MLVEFAIFEKKVKAQITVLLQKQQNCKKKKKKKKMQIKKIIKVYLAVWQ